MELSLLNKKNVSGSSLLFHGFIRQVIYIQILLHLLVREHKTSLLLVQ